MNINAVNDSNLQAGQLGMSPENDAVSKGIKSQIARVQKQLQELAQNKDLSVEEKMKQRQELQQQINDLNNQLRQHQIELRKERQQQKSEAQKANDNQSKADSQSKEQAQTTYSMLSADNALKQSRVHDKVATEKEGRANVLKVEIKLDSGRGVSTEAKEKELAKVEQDAEKARASQAESLGEANNAISANSKDKSHNTDEGEAVSEKEKEEKENSLPKMYDSEGKAVEEEIEPTVSARV